MQIAFYRDAFRLLHRYQWNSSALISRLEIIDQSNGTGGFVFYISGDGSGIGIRTVFVLFDLMTEGSTIDFIINVYSEPITHDDSIDGQRNRFCLRKY